ncbi:MAG: 4Fe-4S binding protein, partial [Bullifex sp.]
MKTSRIRLFVQAAAFAFQNGYLKGFAKGNVYKGNLKKLCTPGLNCYSCPGAVTSCPIGALQAVSGTASFTLSLYVLGFILVVGALSGRFVCGWICPFGLVQRLLHKIPVMKKRKNLPGHQVLKYLKYAVLAFFVFLLPVLSGSPAFCAWICPSGTLFGAIPLTILNGSLRNLIGSAFFRKASLLVLVMILSVKYARPFCKYLCPLGALYGLLNPVSVHHIEINHDKCTGCGACRTSCPMDVKVWENPD